MLGQLLDNLIEAELRGDTFSLDSLTTTELDDVRLECEATDGYEAILEAVEAEISARFLAILVLGDE